jgi:hypothetical protein
MLFVQPDQSTPTYDDNCTMTHIDNPNDDKIKSTTHSNTGSCSGRSTLLAHDLHLSDDEDIDESKMVPGSVLSL